MGAQMSAASLEPDLFTEEAAALGRSQAKYWRKTLAAIGIKPE